MKQSVLLTAVGASCLWLLLGVGGAANAQVSGGTMVKGEIPFAFVSGDNTVQAGEYSIEIRQRDVWIRDANGHELQHVFSGRQQINAKAERPRLVFHQYGDKYYLEQIWSSNYKVDMQMSRAEHSLRQEADLKENTPALTWAMR